MNCEQIVLVSGIPSETLAGAIPKLANTVKGACKCDVGRVAKSVGSVR